MYELKLTEWELITVNNALNLLNEEIERTRHIIWITEGCEAHDRVERITNNYKGLDNLIEKTYDLVTQIPDIETDQMKK